MGDPAGLLLADVDDAHFSRAVSALKFGNTFKTTERSRYPLTIKALQNINLLSNGIILDVGASDGIGSLDAIKSLTHSQYFVTDLNTSIKHIEDGREHYFFDSSGKCILISSQRFVWYKDLHNAIWPFKQLAREIFSGAPRVDRVPYKTISLFNSEVIHRPDVTAQNHNLFEPWGGPKPDLIIAANILNRSYFTDIELTQAISRLIKNLKGDGYLAIIDSRKQERASLFCVVAGQLELLDSINGGAETQALTLSIPRQASRQSDKH